MISCTRIHLPPSGRWADRNIRPQYAIESASWIWHPGLGSDDVAVVRFSNTFTLDEARTVRLHVSADERYELCIDGQWVSMGPDRCDANHWSFASYDVELEAGEHRIEATVQRLAHFAPHAQVSLRPAFILKSEGLDEQLDTGVGPWRVQKLGGLGFQTVPMRAYHVIGPSFTLDASGFFEPVDEPVEPVVVRGPVGKSVTGIVAPLWGLWPSPLPDMIRRPVRTGTVRAVAHRDELAAVTEADMRDPQAPAWQALLDGTPLTVAPRTTVHVVWDLDEYYCGFPLLTLSGGRGASAEVQWAEALYHLDDAQQPTHKGQRDEVVGKVFFGFGDRFVTDGKPRTFRSLWWRSGRYVLLSVRTADEPLTLDPPAILETRYPYEPDASWRSSDTALDAATPIMVRAMQMCSHETYMDCPCYEQMMYVGDTRLEMLTGHVLFADDRLTRRGIELFDWSRWRTGFVAERYPSTPYQLSLTFAMLWVSMVRDYAWWRDEPAFVRERLVGVRAMLEHFRTLLNDQDLLEDLPGWSFMDWGPGWFAGNAPDGEHGVSALNNLLFVQALQHAADLETACGEKAMARRNRALAARVAAALVRTFWDEPRGLLADDPAHAHFSEHAQSLAILTDILDETRRDRALHGLLHDEGLARATVYFSFYLLEALAKLGRGDLLHQRLDFWKDLIGQGFKTTVEKPEPSRSDCHAWGAHPLWHMHASLAGVRPGSAGFRTVRIAPSPGPLTSIDATIPHPRGRIVTSLRFDGDACSGTVELPKRTRGTFVWRGETLTLRPGANRIP